jgi:hypothetical protein
VVSVVHVTGGLRRLFRSKKNISIIVKQKTQKKETYCQSVTWQAGSCATSPSTVALRWCHRLPAFGAVYYCEGAGDGGCRSYEVAFCRLYGF